MTPQTSLLVDYELVPVAKDAYPHGEGQVWADASPEHASRLIERLLDDPAEARAMGARARRHIRENFSVRDRKRVVEGKSVTVRVDREGRRKVKKKIKKLK